MYPQDHDLRQKDHDSADPADHAVDDQAAQCALGHGAPHGIAQGADARVDQLHERRRAAKYRLKHDEHHQ
jgi:hypothetical protein